MTCLKVQCVLQAPWEMSVRAAMDAAGLHEGDTALHVGRHFSLRDALKWARRMQVTPLRCMCLAGSSPLLLLHSDDL